MSQPIFQFFICVGFFASRMRVLLFISGPSPEIKTFSEFTANDESKLKDVTDHLVQLGYKFPSISLAPKEDGPVFPFDAYRKRLTQLELAKDGDFEIYVRILPHGEICDRNCSE